MTDKQIIIDGVDVKDCKRRIGKDNFCRYYKRPCAENNYNCIWKKYLRKEQECETLTSQLDFEVQKKECLEQECEALGQAYLEANELLQEKTKECTNLKAENEEWKKANDCILTTLNVIAEGNKKLRQTLAEIKEIAEENKETAQYRGVCLSILQKISEVEDENS